jgi:hypothetical protein
MDKNGENYFLDKKLLNNLQQSNHLQSQLKVFLYKDLDLIAAKNSQQQQQQQQHQSSLLSPPRNLDKDASNNGLPTSHLTKKNKRNLLRSRDDFSKVDPELQEYLLLILQLYQHQSDSGGAAIMKNLKYFLEDSANFFIIENYSKNRQSKLKQLQASGGRQSRFR